MNPSLSRINGAFGCLFLLLASSAGGLSPRALAQAPEKSQPLGQTLLQAEEDYRQDKLLPAEQAYRQALRTATGDERQRCFDRLLTIYARVGRLDQAITIALEYETWARQTGKRRRARELNLAAGGWYLALGHYDDAEKHMRRALADGAEAALPPGKKVTALTYLALAAEKQGDRDRADLAWQSVAAFARGMLDDSPRELDPRQRIDCVRSLAESYRFHGRPEAAIPYLEQLLPVHEKLKDSAGKRDTLRQLADHLAASKRLGDAEQHLRQALQLHEQLPSSDPLSHADLASALADVLERQDRARDAESWRSQAIRDYQAVQAAGLAGRIERAGALSAFWKLQALYQRTSQFDRALKLTRDLAEQSSGEFLIEYRLKAEQGSLQIVLGEFARSRPLLRETVAELANQSPRNLIELPRALLNLAVVELALGGRGDAAKLGKDCVDLYQTYHLPDDLVLVEAYNLLGTCAAQDGDYAPAIDHFREGVRRCDRLGGAADPQKSNLLLNMALVHKAQGDLKQALVVCQKAEEVHSRFAAPDSLAVAAFKAAQANLLAAQAEIDQANTLSGKVLELCDKFRVRNGPLVITALHCQALFHLHHRDFANAEKTWRQVQDLQGPKSPQLPRTLNYLALTQECQGQLAKAEALYREAKQLQDDNSRAFPVTHFATLWRLANVVDRQERHAEARTLLGEAVTVVERARLRTYGDAEQRATFFAQFAPGFEQSVEWNIRDGDVNAAVAAAARGRSRTLLDQLLMAGVDPRQGLQGASGDELRRQEAEGRRRIATLRAQAQLLSADSLTSKPAQELLAEFDQAQQQYAEVYREILNASPVYHPLSQPEFSAADLALLRDRVLGPKKLLLVYHVGRERSYLLLLGGGLSSAEAVPLMVPAEVAERAVSPTSLPLGEALSGRRGLVLDRPLDQPEMPPPLAAPGPAVPLSQVVLRALVDGYLEQAADPRFRPTRGLRLESSDAARPLPAQPPEFLGQLLLPPPIRKRILGLAPECLIIIPDGALHKLPFEALLLTRNPKPAYVLDELPPLAYAPSVAILAQLGKRPPVARTSPLSLLTVADPAYPETKTQAEGANRSAQPGVLALRGQLPRLRYAAQESERISRLFPAGQVTALRRDQATEKAVVAALPGKRIVHLAVHGLADDRFGNQFGALALAPSPSDKASPEDNGFLSLHAIYTLPLQECELAVLSACLTNVGPQLPLEGGVTLAGGFLAAGTRRVVASHWDVDDESTAELMGAFFEEVLAAARQGKQPSYARALQEARRRVRGQAKWSSPFYWAPFVLIGPSD